MKRSLLVLLVAISWILIACGGGDVEAARTAATVSSSTTAAAGPPVATTAVASSGRDYDYDDSEDGDKDTEYEDNDYGDGVTTAAGPVSIGAENFGFSPANVTIKVGDSVQWILREGNHSSTSGSAPSPDGGWNQVITADAPVSVTFDQAGQFRFFCRFHPDSMQGTVVVEP